MENTKHIIYFLVILLNVLCLSLSIYFMFPNFIRIFSFLTIISLTFDTIYLAGVIWFERLGDISSSNYRNFMDIFYKYTFILSFTVTIFFWALLIAGPIFFEVARNAVSWSFLVWTHGGITIVIITDMFFSDHQKEKSFGRDVAVSLAFYLTYGMWILLATRHFGIKLYPFLLNLSIPQNVLILICIYLVSVFGYNFYKKMLKVKIKRKRIETEEFVAVE